MGVRGCTLGEGEMEMEGAPVSCGSGLVYKKDDVHRQCATGKSDPSGLGFPISSLQLEAAS